MVLTFLRLKDIQKITVPIRTYIATLFLANKLNIQMEWSTERKDYYYLTDNIIDAAVLWKKDSYILEHTCPLVFSFKTFESW